MKNLFAILTLTLLFSLTVKSQTNVQLLSNGDMFLLTNEAVVTNGKLMTSYFTDITKFKSGDIDAYGELSEYYNLSKSVSITGQINTDLNSFDKQLSYAFLGGLSLKDWHYR